MEQIQTLDLENFKSCINNNEWVIIYCWDENCKPCQSIKKNGLLEKLNSEFSELSLFKLEMNGSREIGEFNILGVPSFLIFKNGQYFSKKTGLNLQSDIRDEFRPIFNKPSEKIKQELDDQNKEIEKLIQSKLNS